jgi:hypothetical protein
MTLKELAARIKTRVQSDPLELARAIVKGAEIAEYTLYRPTSQSRWKEILEQLNLGSLEARTVCLTVYSTDSSVFEAIKRSAKKKYGAVANFSADDMGYREIFLIGKDAEKEPDVILLVNFYETSRESVKAQYRSESEDNADASNSDDTAEPEDLEIDLEPFA